MVNYNNGKIYKIEPKVEHDIDEVYVGSTTKKYLSQRLTAHRGAYNQWKKGQATKVMAYNLFDTYGFENCQIILLENVQANSRDELHAREAHHIKSIICINKYIPLRSDKEYYQDNKEIILNRVFEYNKNHKDEKKEYDNEYRKKTPFVCACGSTVSFHHKSDHLKTKKHINFINVI